MLAFFFLLITLWFGYLLARRLPLSLYGAEALAVGTVAAGLAGGWVWLVAALLFPYSWSLPISALVMALAAGFLMRRPLRPLLAFPEKGWFLWWAMTMLSVFVLGWLFYTHMLQVKDGAWYSAGGAWGDLALHASLITHFANQSRFDFSFPLLAGGKLTYPFLIDFLSGLLYRGGWSIQLSLLVPGFALCLALVQLVFFLGLRWFKSVLAGALAMPLFVLNGSFGGLTYAWLDYQASNQSLFTFLNTQPQEYSHLADHNLLYTNVVSGALLPQRSILLGFSALCILLLLMYEAWHRGKESRGLLLTAGVMLGLLPFAHPHSYLVGMVLFAVAMGASLVMRRHDRWWWVCGFCLALVLALPQGLWQLMAMPHAPEYSRWYLGWVKKPDDNLILFWIRTLGLELPVVLGLPLILWRLSKSRFLGLMGGGLLVIFFALNAYLFQPYDYDNIKLLLAVHLGSALAGAAVLAWLVRRWRFGWLIAAPAFAILCASGFLTVWHQSTISWQFMSAQDVAFATDFSKVVPKDALVLTADLHDHPIPVMTGRNIVMGYRGWLWSYGIQYQQQEADVAAMFRGGSMGDSLFQKYGVSYVVIGPPEESTWNASQAYFGSQYPVVLDEYGWQVYKVR